MFILENELVLYKDDMAVRNSQSSKRKQEKKPLSLRNNDDAECASAVINWVDYLDYYFGVKNRQPWLEIRIKKDW